MKLIVQVLLSTYPSAFNSTKRRKYGNLPSTQRCIQETVVGGAMIDSSRETPQQDSSISRAADKKNRYYSLLYAEMAERKRAEEHLRRSNLLLQALSQAQLHYVAGTDLSLVFSSLLRSLLTALHAQQGLLRDHKVTDETPNTSRLLIHESQAEGWEQVHLNPIADQVWLTRRPILLTSDHNRDALPNLSPDAPSCYFLGLPIAGGVNFAGETILEEPLDSDKIVGVIVIAGRADDYDPDNLELLQPLLATCAQLILAHRNDQRRRAAELALAEERSLLAQRVAERTAELSFSNAELARAAHAKDEFLATMNHELRTPLNAVLLYAESLQTQLPGPLNERQLRAVGGIHESAHHLLSLINDILDVAKMDAGKLSLDITSSEVESVCQSSLRLVAEMAQQKQLDLRFRRNPIVTRLDVDERRLKQMLMNLLSNAIKFTPEGGRVGLEVDGDIENDFVHFTVWDTGSGIAAEDIKKLFQPFVQLDSRHVRQHGGTGLGLFLVYRMAELHGGSVSVTSQIHQGSRFTISLPWHQQRQPASPDSLQLPSLATLPSHPNNDMLRNPVTDSAGPWGQQPDNAMEQVSQIAQPAAIPQLDASSNLAVLVVDDNEANLRVLLDFLQEWHCRVLVARTGAEAVQQAKEERPALILMDIQMPEMNGLDAIRLIRSEEASKPNQHQSYIVALTALAMPGDREQCLAAGADDYISKPIRIERLTEVLSLHLQRSSLTTLKKQL
jgi:signal transduction histidine kinase/AmiR/NasT family two-component response regulator